MAVFQLKTLEYFPILFQFYKIVQYKSTKTNLNTNLLSIACSHMIKGKKRAKKNKVGLKKFKDIFNVKCSKYYDFKFNILSIKQNKASTMLLYAKNIPERIHRKLVTSNDS